MTARISGMTLTGEQGRELMKQCDGVLKWLNDNCHPHCTVVVKPGSVEVVETLLYVPEDKHIES